MMKSKRVMVLFVLLLIVFTLVGSQSVTARAVRTDFTGVEIMGEEIDPGIWDYLPNGAMHLHGQIFTATEISTDLRMSGTAIVVMNANLDPSLTGPFWGTYSLTVEPSEDCPEGGRWEGAYAGKLSYSQYYAYYHAVIHGISGCVMGMKANVDADCFAGTFNGTILDPHGE